VKINYYPKLIFVYGTLRRGECNHYYLRNVPRLAMHRTAPRYTLLHLGSYPAAVVEGNTAIVGELYPLNQTLLKRLDRLEAYPDEYIREPIPTSCGPAWMYVYRHPAVPDTPVITNGDWLLGKRLVQRRQFADASG
jgi:gamma-glutamylcyclotransferase (GGCT)/AIG2-like uncharacterized protein YtfP